MPTLTDSQVKQVSHLIGDLSKMTGFTRRQITKAVVADDNLALALYGWVLGGIQLTTVIDAVYGWASSEGGE